MEPKKKNKKFAIGAWLFSILLTLTLATIIGVFYYKNFEPSQAIPYYLAIAFLSTVSIWLTKYHDEPNEPFTKASFTCKCVLLFIMCINAAFCFSLGREMSVARKLTDTQRAQETEYLNKLSELQKASGPRAKLALAEAMKDHKAVDVSAESKAFKDNESYAFALMIAEFLAGATVVLLMMGLTIFAAPKTSEVSSETSEETSEVSQNLGRNVRSRQAPQGANFDTRQQRTSETSRNSERYFKSDGSDFVRLQRMVNGARVIGRDGSHQGWVTLRKLDKLESEGVTYEGIMRVRSFRAADARETTKEATQ